MNVKGISIFAAAAMVLAATTLPGTAAADERWDRGGHGHGRYQPWKHAHGHGHGHYQPWKHTHGHGHHRPWAHGFYAYAAPVMIPAPVYAPPPPVYYPSAGNDLTIIWRGGW